ncbi:MAG TPA: N,N-dimethylformamidase beta subunit family domain-containing protein [Solirubrobacteraceae bacterium]|nr:N,N-dimethylformamidase beta subunit family domain-containing protein [Solirubrobacteraceae bacterium]
MTRLAGGVFAALVVATFAAFLVAQRLKNEPSVVQRIMGATVFSPNQDSRFDRMRISFTLSEDDEVRATVIDDEGDPVATVAEDLSITKWRQARVAWDGITDDGERAPDGRYRVRLTLERQGRTVTLRRSVLLDTTPPRPRVVDIGPEAGDGPELLPRRDGAPAQIRFRAPGRQVEVEVWRTDRGPRLVRTLAPKEGGVTTWDGRNEEGRRLAPGTFAVVVRSRDRAGNIGSNAPRPLRLRRGARIAGRAGITIRYLGLQPPVVPIKAGEGADVGVDSRGAAWRWTLRRVGSPLPSRRGRHSSGGAFRVRPPNGKSGLFLYEVNTRDRQARVPLAVDDRKDNRVLVVLPATTWQGRNPVDDDGDGLPNTLELGGPAKVDRVFAGDGLPQGLTESEAPLLAHLDRTGLRYDLTTDVALAVRRGPQIERHRGVLLAGDTVWLTEDVRRRLRAFAAGDGHTLVSLGIDSLRRDVDMTGGRLDRPGAPERSDLFGARLGELRDDQPVDLTIRDDDPQLQLFAGGEGLFTGVEAWEPTLDVGGEARALSTAGPTGEPPAIVAVRYGQGLVIRPGIRGFATRLSSDVESQELLGRMWTLLTTG